MTLKKLLTQAALLLCKGLVFVYDAVTIPVFFVVDQPWKYWKLKRIVWAKRESEKDPYSPYIRQPYRSGPSLDGIHTISDLFRNAIAQHNHKRCYGTREVLQEEEVTDQSGRVIKKVSLGDYKWMTYKEVDARIDEVRRGLLSIGIRSRKPVAIFAETRVEWIITAHACFRINTPVVTLYANLGEAGLIHAINETEVTHIITSSPLLPKLKKIISRTTGVCHISYMENLSPPSVDGFPDSVKLMSFSELIECGKNSTDYIFDPPKADDLAVLMYTSGSTGIPKGVLVSHKNVLSTAKGFGEILAPSAIETDDNYNTYVASLPLAHVYELVAETHFSSLGVPVGFSSPQTLTDSSPALKTGCLGDLRVLRPTLLTVVPLMLDRLRNMVFTMAGQEGTLSRELFEFAIKYKIFWMYKGFETRILDRCLLKKCRDYMGGKLKILMCGGAPISPDTQDFIRACLGVQVIQGYGMTETAASASVSDVDDFSTGRVGAPLSTVKLRLVDWKEGGYTAFDVPHPRGEIVLGGDSISRGYYKRDAATNQCFQKEYGISWFYTGDIGEIFPNGTYRIIDRKNDLVKLQFGEYVALGKIEAQLKTFTLVDNICAVGNGLYNHLVALVVPNQYHLSMVAKELGKTKMNFVQMCRDRDIETAVASKIREYGKKCGLVGAEIPAKIKLCPEEWVPENGLVTAALKIRRKEVQEFYKHVINDMFTSFNRDSKQT